MNSGRDSGLGYGSRGRSPHLEWYHVGGARLRRALTFSAGETTKYSRDLRTFRTDSLSSSVPGAGVDDGPGYGSRGLSPHLELYHAGGARLRRALTFSAGETTKYSRDVRTFRTASLGS